MKQAAILDSLRGNVIYTGPPDREDALQSCSAVILANTQTGKGGLFHYPAGRLERQPSAKAVLSEMARIIRPDVAHIVYGRSSDVEFHSFTSVATMADYDDHNGVVDLDVFLLDHVPHTQRQQSPQGAASVGISSGRLWIGLDQTSQCDHDLRNVQAGAFTWGSVLWMADD